MSQITLENALGLRANSYQFIVELLKEADWEDRLLQLIHEGVNSHKYVQMIGFLRTSFITIFSEIRDNTETMNRFEKLLINLTENTTPNYVFDATIRVCGFFGLLLISDNFQRRGQKPGVLVTEKIVQINEVIDLTNPKFMLKLDPNNSLDNITARMIFDLSVIINTDQTSRDYTRIESFLYLLNIYGGIGGIKVVEWKGE